MVKVTSVEPQKQSASRRTKRFNIFLDGEFGFGADEDLVVEQRLVVGKTFTTSDVEHLLFEAEVGKLMDRMYNLFSIRQRSEKEIKDYFRLKNFKSKIKDENQISNLAIESLINRLKQKGMINDLEFAFSWVASRKKKKGSRALKQELFKKGIDREIVEQVIGEQMTDYNEEQVAQRLLEKKVRAWKDLTNLEFKKKAIDFLLRRGFKYEQIKGIVETKLKKGYNN